MTLDTAAASVRSPASPELSLEPLQLAEGILDVINAKMAQAIRTLTVAQGIEPRDFALVAFGGAGPMHAAFLAEELEIDAVVVPRFPGAFSAWGMLETDLRRDFSRSFYAKAAAADLAALGERLRRARGRGPRGARRRGRARRTTSCEHALDMRYEAPGVHAHGRGRRPPRGRLSRADRATVPRGTRSRYGHSNPALRSSSSPRGRTLLGELGRAAPEQIDTGGVGLAPSPRRRLRTPELGPAVVSRDELADELSGPAIVDEQTATTVVPPGWTLRVGALGRCCSQGGEDA